MGLERKKMYWRFQIIAWTAWSMNETLLYINQFGWNLAWIYSSIINIFLGIGLTHSYRILNEKYQWQEKKKIPLSEVELIAMVVISSVFTAVNIALDMYIIEGPTQQELSLFLLLQFFLNFSKPVTIWLLIYFFYQYSQRQLVIQRKNDQLEMAVQESEGRVLRAQMNPHFVFNALNSIRALILENPQKARNSINQLSKLLRNSLLTERKKTIPLAEELETIKDYLELEIIRYEERLRYELTVKEGCEKALIPPMIIQTLVENSIKHGISKEVNGGKIQITIHKIDNLLDIKVSNPGKIEESNTQQGTGLGIENSKNRVQIMYGEKANLTLRAIPQNQVEAHLVIPYLTAK
jgi:sensor histidine kinase YesM